MLKIAFCDDETIAITQLEELLEEYAAARGQEFVHIMVRTVGRPCCSTPLLRKIKNDPKPELGVISGWRSP